jgi:dipeptidyl aminopeptidase/acylaminoacyl peptidase
MSDTVASTVLVVSIAGGSIWRSNLGLRDRDPAWSPDGTTLALISNAEGRDRVWVLNLRGGDNRPLKESPASPRWPIWSPDGRWIAVLSDGDLWTIEVASGSAQHLGPASPVVVPAFSAEGTVAFVRSGAEGDAIWLVRAESSPQEMVQPGGPVRSLAWSPDSSSLAWIGHRHGAAPGRNQHVYSINVKSGRIQDLTAAMDRSVGARIRGDDPRSLDPIDLAWQAEPDRIYFTVADEGRGKLSWVDPSGQTGSIINGEEACLSFCCGRRRCAAIVARVDSPGDLFVYEAGRRLSLLNSNSWLSGVAVPAEPVMAISGGLSIHGWMLRPAGPARGRLPLLLYMHGGPHVPWGYRFSFDFQRIVAAGRTLVYFNPRGSQGYGEAFSTACIGDWGGGDYRDALAILDSILKTGQVDPERKAVMGESYGAYLAAWTVSEHQGFRAAICENGLYDLNAAFDESDDKRGLISEFGGDPATNPGFYLDRSPIHRVSAVNTDILLVHAEDDDNSLISQSEAYQAALLQAGRSVQLFRLPLEGHLVNLVGKPSSRTTRAQAIDLFLRRYLGSAA